MSRHWSVHRLRDLYAPGCHTDASVTLPNGNKRSRWVRAVCEPYHGGRLRAAWEVLCGRAYAFEWPKPGDFENILEGGD